ncbi:hypothetical protein V3564_00955 [Bartonella sp. B12(2025)]
MKTDIDSLCDLWLVLFKLCNRDDIDDEECNSLVNSMDAVENVLVLKLKKEYPHIIRLLAVLTDCGGSNLPKIIDPFLRAYDPTLESSLKKVA